MRSFLALLLLCPACESLRVAKTPQPPSAQRQTTPLKHAQRLAKSALLAGALSSAAAPALASMDTAGIGQCVIKECGPQLTRCLTSPRCAANLVCINSCTGRKDESECQIRCGDLFENAVVGDFNACAVSQKKCVPQRQDDGAYPAPAPESVVTKFDTRVFDGRWYISAGLNEAFDTFDCQVHFFTAPTPKTLYGQLNWRITEPDGEFFTRDVVQRFVEDDSKPGVLYNHGNEYLHYEDDWYILDYDGGKSKDDPDAFVLVYYRGRNDAWIGYGGAVVYTRTPVASPAVYERSKAAWERANLPQPFSNFKRVENACLAESAPERVLLRERYAKKVLLTGEKALQEEVTQVRRAAVSTVSGDVKAASRAVAKLEKQIEAFEKEIEKDVVSLEKEVEKDVLAVEREVEKDVFGRGAPLVFCVKGEYVMMSKQPHPARETTPFFGGGSIDLEEPAQVDVEVARERDHHVARVLGEALDRVERGHDEALALRQARQEAEHREAAVVDLDLAPARLLLLRLLREDVEGLVEVQGDLAAALALDRGVVAGQAALRVVHVAGRRAGALAVRLEHADEHED
eukprot:CAMPEP_0119259054 /NCGR_PEP_ID=MMETSP1329-20130426/25_1 /TAXON_ID=114041 /ORGANISM="Genus nov. species nov., Strain RCC1024" /LENGTH=572 /DNA_ID=CAMNT_0007258409 /DNA_START=114 /DNA_END=1829 /DNA_ORIENTATION=-